MILCVGLLSSSWALPKICLWLDVRGGRDDGGADATLVLDLDLFQAEDWVVSTHSTDSMFGKVDVRFWIAVAHAGGELTERPESTWEVEHFSQLDIRVLRQDTEMRLPVRATSSRDFEARASVLRAGTACMPFEVDFTVGRRAGCGPLNPRADAKRGSREAIDGGRCTFEAMKFKSLLALGAAGALLRPVEPIQPKP